MYLPVDHKYVQQICVIFSDFHASERATLEANAIRWKFTTLDKDKNKSLNKTEYRDLRKLIKKVVKPRRCSRAFVRLCDIDHDSIISEEEWRTCLNIDSGAGKLVPCISSCRSAPICSFDNTRPTIYRYTYEGEHFVNTQTPLSENTHTCVAVFPTWTISRLYNIGQSLLFSID